MALSKYSTVHNWARIDDYTRKQKPEAARPSLCLDSFLVCGVSTNSGMFAFSRAELIHERLVDLPHDLSDIIGFGALWPPSHPYCGRLMRLGHQVGILAYFGALDGLNILMNHSQCTRKISPDFLPTFIKIS